MELTHEIMKEMAGPLYGELLRSKDAALAHLHHVDRNVRIAAINMCERIWGCSSEGRFVDACRQIAATDPDDAVRDHALEALGNAFQATRDALASQFLADIVKENTAPERVRQAAYWALREVQLGSTEEENVRRLAALLKLASRAVPLAIDEQQAKQAILCGGRFPESVWDTADQIDWDFVDQFASAK